MARQMTHKITLGGKQVANADASMTASIPPAFGTAFSHWNPLGFVPGRCWVVMRREDISDLIDGSEKHDLVITGTANESGLTGSETTFKDQYVVKATRATVGPASSDDAPYLVELADKRFILSKFSDTGDIISNLNSFANDTTFLTNSTTNGTWAALFAALWAALPSDVAGIQPTLPFTPDGVPENWHFHGQNGWQAIEIFLNKLDVSLSYSPHTGLFTAVLLSADQTLPDLPVKPYHDADPLEHGSTKVPAEIEVYRHVHRLSYGQERDKELAQNWALGDGHDSNTETTGKTGAVSGTVLPIWDDLKEKKDENDATTNTAGLSTRSTNRSDTRANSLNISRVHRIFPGVHEVLPGSQVKLVLHRQLIDDRHIGGMVTEFIAGPEMVRSVGPGNHAGTSVAVGWSPAGEGLQAPDLGRATYPTYPRLPEIVQVNDTGATTGAEIGPNANNLFPGRVARWVSGSLTTLDNCWIRFVDDHSNNAGDLRVKNQDYFLARLSGVETSVASTLPIYLARSGSNPSIFRFETTVVKSYGADVKGDIVDENGVTITAGVGLVDLLSHFGPSPIDAGGYCVRMPDNLTVVISPDTLDAYEIIHMEGFAEHIEFTLTEDMGASTTDQASITQTDFWGPPHLALDPSATIVNDTQQKFGACMSGDKGLALFDPSEDIYVIVNCGGPRIAYGELQLSSSGFVYTAPNFQVINFDADGLSDNVTTDSAGANDLEMIIPGRYILNWSMEVDYTEDLGNATCIGFFIAVFVNGTKRIDLDVGGQRDPVSPEFDCKHQHSGTFIINLAVGDDVDLRFDSTEDFFLSEGFFNLHYLGPSP